MAARGSWYWLVVLLSALPVLGADYSAGFDRTCVSPEVLELVSVVTPDNIVWSTIAGALQSVNLPDGWGDVVGGEDAMMADVVGGTQPVVLPEPVEVVGEAALGEAVEGATVEGIQLSLPLQTVSVVGTAAAGQVAEGSAVGAIQPIALPGVAVGPIDAYAAGLLASLRQEARLDEQSFSAWVAEQGVETETLIGMLDGLSLAWPMGPEYKPICAVLWERIGDDINTYLAFPPRARGVMAMYLGVLGRDQDVRTLMESYSASERMGTHVPHYLVASQLLTEGKSLRAAIWAWKRAAEMRGPADRAEVCLEIRMSCRQLGDPEVAREELIPWAEDALARPGSERWWSRALPALLWAYEYVGAPQKAVERGRYWLEQGRQRNVPAEKLAGAKLRVAKALARTNQFIQAADMLRQLIGEGLEWTAESAQVELLKLAQTHPDIGDVEILRPQFKRMWPEKLSVRLCAGGQTSKFVNIAGNSTFKVAAASCELPWIETSVGSAELAGQASSYQVQLGIGPSEEMGTYEGVLTIQTNDADNATIQVPVSVEVLSPITLRPDSFFFGFMKPGETKTATITLTGTVPFEITGSQTDRPELVTVEVAKQEDGSYQVKATLDAPNQPGTVEGNIEVRTNLAGQPTIIILYYAQISARE